MPLSTLIRRGLLSLLVAVAITMVPTGASLARAADNARYAAIVLDAESGEVLFARHADSRRYPASITKVMTLYLTFEAVAEGRLNMDDVITVSRHAASQPPSKLGLAAGQTITVEDAIRATAMRSANDMAMALAEHISGSQERFAAQMTLKGRELGMTQTRYINPSGLPDARQLTSARDLAILVRAVMRDYPQYYSYFGQHDWVYNGREYRNTNGLLRVGEGYDGLKTGFTNASGYNLAATAVRDGRRLITIVLGGRSTATRNAHVSELMNTGFEVERARARGETIQVAQTFFEARGFGIGPDNSGPIQYAALADSPEGETGTGSSAPPPGSVTLAALATPASASARVTTAPAGRPADVTAILNGGAPVAAPPRPRPPAARPPAARPPAGRWSVQVGAFRDESIARNWLTEVHRRFRSQFAAAERTVQNAEGWHRSRFTGMTEQAARAACATLAERRVTCMVVRPD